jgi:hypothetical protein
VTAPRVCRSCGADLALDVRWCTLCFAPITEYAARERLHDGFVGSPQPAVRSSRWTKAGPLAFGPVGRILVTALVLLMGPWGSPSFFTIMYVPIWLGLSIVVLKQVWRRERLDDDAPATVAERFRERHPILGIRFDGMSVAIVLGVMLLAIVVVLLLRADTAGFYALVSLCAMVGLAAFIAWVADV